MQIPMFDDFGFITGLAIRRPRGKPATFLIDKKFLKRSGMNSAAIRRGFLVPEETHGMITSFKVYADTNRSKIFDSNDLQLGQINVSPQGLGYYETFPHGKKGRFSFDDGVFSLTFRDRVIAQGDL